MQRSLALTICQPQQAVSRCLAVRMLRCLRQASCMFMTPKAPCMLCRLELFGLSIGEAVHRHAQIKLHDFDEGALNGLEERSPADAMRILEVFRTSNPQEKDNKCEMH